MKRKIFKRTFAGLLFLGFIYWVPFIIISINSQSNIISSIEQLPNSDVVIIFVTIVNDSGEVTPLLKERLEAGKSILQSGKSKKIVVSNTKNAANIMAKYLYESGISSDLIEVDIHADKTPDTCLYEKK